MKKLIVAVLVVLLASSCVSNKKFNSMKAEALRLEGELAASRNRLDDMTGQNEKLAAEKARLVADTVRLSGELNDYRRRYKQLLDDGCGRVGPHAGASWRARRRSAIARAA